MATTLDRGKKSQRPIPPAGMQIARCYSIIDLGTQNKPFNGVDKLVPLIHFSWEIPQHTHVFDQNKGPQPLAIFQEYTASLQDRAALKKMLCAWDGVSQLPPTVSLKDYLGKVCLISIIHEPSKDVVLPFHESMNGDGRMMYAKISTVAPLMQGMVCPPMINAPVFLDLDINAFNWQAFKSIPPFMREKVKMSKEWPTIVQYHGSEPADQQPGQQAYQAPVQQFQQPVQQQYPIQQGQGYPQQGYQQPPVQPQTQQFTPQQFQPQQPPVQQPQQAQPNPFHQGNPPYPTSPGGVQQPNGQQQNFQQYQDNPNLFPGEGGGPGDVPSF